MFGNDLDNNGPNFSGHCKMQFAAISDTHDKRDDQLSVSPIPCSLQIRIVLLSKDVLPFHQGLTKERNLF